MQTFTNGYGTQNGIVLKRYSSTTEPRTSPLTPSAPSSPNGFGGGGGGGGLVLSPSTLPAVGDDDDVFVDEKLKENNNEQPPFSPPPYTPGTAHAPQNSWPNRKLRTRHCLWMAAFIVLVILIAVGVALAVIFTSRNESEDSSVSTTQTPVITYSGNFLLHSPWQGTTEQLQFNLSQDFVTVLSESPLEKFYRGTTLQSWNGTEVSFTVDFHPDVTYLVDRTSPDRVRVREFLQQELRALVAETETVLHFIPETVTLTDYIPYTSTISTTTLSSTPPASTTTTTEEAITSAASSTSSITSSSSPSFTTTPHASTSTVAESTSAESTTTEEATTPSPTTTPTTTVAIPDECIELQFPPCMGLGYTHYSLPSLMGAYTEEFAIEDFYSLGNASLSSGCTNDPTFFCGFAFPPCSAKSPQTLPCLDLCETTVQRCAEYIPIKADCDGYPTEQPCLKSPFPPVTPPTTTPEPDTCSPQTFERCRKLGFDVTLFPTWFAENLTMNVNVFEKWAMPAILSRCHADVEFFMCGAFFPKCDEVQDSVIYPCKSLCEDIEKSCHDRGDILHLDCRMFDTDHSSCLLPTGPPSSSTPSPLTTTLPVTTTSAPVEHLCLPISIDTCRHFGHVNGSLPSTWGAHDAATTLSYYYEYLQPVVSSGCAPSALFYMCQMLFPSCDHGVYQYPCRSVCEEYNTKCSGRRGFLLQNCSFFETSSCLMPPATPSCTADQFACEGAPICIPSASVCNHINDCGDWSDERQCQCEKDFEYKCDMGLCIRSYKRCDGETDCPDKSDEIGCKPNCTMGRFQCDDGTCLMQEWVCDGQYDCPRTDNQDTIEEDEVNCSTCSPKYEFACITGAQCIQAEQRCDGTPQCADQTDEKNCIMMGPPAFLNAGGIVSPICSSTFTMDLAHTACQRLGYSGAKSWSSEEDYHIDMYFQPSPSGDTHTVIGTGSLVNQCSGSNAVAMVDCQPTECTHQTNLVDNIIDGEPAEKGQLPWQASIQEFGKHFCGGSLIHPSFVLTAAHCVEKYALNTEYLEVVLGAVNLKGDEPEKKIIAVKRVINYPDYVTFQGNDIALVELKEPAVYSDTIKPLCLRQSDQRNIFSRASPCYTAGWGKMDPDSNAMADQLQVVKMTLWDTAKCNSSFAWAGQLQSTEICAGYYAGIKAACRGDSGGALFCRDNDYTWRVVGVASYVHKGCNNPEKPVVFTDAVRYNEWIANKTMCRFPCRNGRCLYDEAMVCNKKNDCGDNSDEIDTCDISANCTFEDPYLCGYLSNWLTVSHALTANRYPLFDHTIGRYPGLYQLGAFRAKNLHTPRIDLMSQHCFRFRYHMRGWVEQGMAVSLHKLSQSGSWSVVWHRQRFEGPDRWLLGQFDLGAGNFDIVFSPYDNGVVSVDDMLLLPGKCAVQSCGIGEFACNTSGSWNCLPNALKCNIVIDCDDGLDENNCTASSYKCDFENGLLCGLEQDSHDSTSGEWRLVNASQAGFDDVTMADGSGHMLQIVTERMLTKDYVYMGHSLRLDGHSHCLQFSYRSTSTAKLEVSAFQSDESFTILWAVENRQTTGWARTQVQIPAYTSTHLYYTVLGRELNRTVLHPAITLDGITITRGICPEFTCPSGQSKCSSEMYCVENSRLCDRVQDCNEFADEITCNCTAEEFKCPTGPCIPLDRTCDTIRDCPDGSDEGRICDSLRSTNCDFEDRFMCGYTHNGSRSDYPPYVWTRERNRKPGEAINVGTGPIYDHTYQNASGHWAFANGENGKPFEYVALQSPPFSSNGNQVLVFYYFAYNYFSKFWLTGSLGLLVKNRTGNDELVWQTVVDGNDTWRSGCVQLPRHPNMTVTFVAMRGQAQKADLAVDDIKLLSISCDQFYLESRLQTGASTQHPPVPTSAPPSECPAGQSKCRNGLCLDNNHFCDGLRDCVDSSDEENCGSESQGG